ncbi:MAG: GNAT family N-acetyltransferase [Flavobacteriales bacterium]|nr:GNAT family N-acetyltransferase [Flavobacteriales bacterium]
MSIIVRKANQSDKTTLYKMFIAVAKAGEAFMYDKSTTYKEWELFWFGKKVATYVAIDKNSVIGSYILKSNNPGAGKHVANGGYLVDNNQKGKGIGILLGEHSLKEAKQMGYTAIQFNVVVVTNIPAVKLWEKLGFKITGTNLKAFHHKTKGLVDTFVMHKEL